MGVGGGDGNRPRRPVVVLIDPSFWAEAQRNGGVVEAMTHRTLDTYRTTYGADDAAVEWVRRSPDLTESMERACRATRERIRHGAFPRSVTVALAAPPAPSKYIYGRSAPGGWTGK